MHGREMAAAVAQEALDVARREGVPFDLTVQGAGYEVSVVALDGVTQYPDMVSTACVSMSLAVTVPGKVPRIAFSGIEMPIGVAWEVYEALGAALRFATGAGQADAAASAKGA